MPSPRQPDHIPLPDPPPPTCRVCGALMSLAQIEPSPKYTNLDVWRYRCYDCGARFENFVAHRV